MGLTLSLMRPIGPGSRAIVKDWAHAVLQTPQIFRRLAFRKRTLEEELQQVHACAAGCTLCWLGCAGMSAGAVTVQAPVHPWPPLS